MKVSRGDHTCRATVLVQKNAPLDLLVGTDLLCSLGFRFLQIGEGDRAMDLLQEAEWNVIPNTSGGKSNHSDPPVPGDEPYSKEKTVEVQHLTAIRLRARHGRPIHAKVDDVMVEWTIANNLGEEGVVIEDAAVKLGADSCVTLVIHSHTLEMVHLPAGNVIGWLQSAELLPVPDADNDQRQTTTQEGVVRLLTSDSVPDVQTKRGTSPLGREECLLEVVDMIPALVEDERE